MPFPDLIKLENKLLVGGVKHTVREMLKEGSTPEEVVVGFQAKGYRSTLSETEGRRYIKVTQNPAFDPGGIVQSKHSEVVEAILMRIPQKGTLLPEDVSAFLHESITRWDEDIPHFTINVETMDEDPS